MTAQIILGVDFKSKRAAADQEIWDCALRNELAAKVNAELREKYADTSPSEMNPGKDSM